MVLDASGVATSDQLGEVIGWFAAA